MDRKVHPESRYGSRDELLSRLRDCLRFAEQTVTCADPTASMWRVDLGQVSGFEKMMMEVGLLAYLADRSPCCHEDARRLAEVVRRHYDSASAVTCILRHPRLAASLGTLLLVLDHFGLASEQETAAVRSAFDSPYVESSEHVPFRLLDRRWVYEMATGRANPLDEAIRLSTACRVTHPIYMSRDDGYAITHTAMYATDFGARPAPAALRGEALWETVDAAIAWCLAAGDFDLLAELLLAQFYIRGELSGYGEIAWHQSRMTWDRMGFLPSPSLSADAFADCTDAASRRQYAFHNMYHTVLVGGLLCLACLDHQATVPAAPTPHRDYVASQTVEQALKRAADHLTAVMGIGQKAAEQVIAGIQWSAERTDLDNLVAAWSEGRDPSDIVRRMAIDGSIVLAAHNYNLPHLASALRTAGRAGVATLTVEVGADFLARQSLVSGAIGAGWLRSICDQRAGEHDDLESARITASLANCLAGLSAGNGFGQAIHP